jgi:hypothetical protein
MVCLCVSGETSLVRIVSGPYAVAWEGKYSSSSYHFMVYSSLLQRYLLIWLPKYHIVLVTLLTWHSLMVSPIFLTLKLIYIHHLIDILLLYHLLISLVFLINPLDLKKLSTLTILTFINSIKSAVSISDFYSNHGHLHLDI